ncbi:hypothetical protein BH23PAT1_BH23PAT1_3230 [soil metagenome]
MADIDERDTRPVDDRRKDTVVVTEGNKSPIGWIIGLIILLLIIFFLFANPFRGGNDNGDVQVPAGDTNIEAPEGDTNINLPEPDFNDGTGTEGDGTAPPEEQ